MTITKGKVTEIIIKVDDYFLEQAKLKGMESKYELIRCKDCKYQEVSTFFGRKLYGCELAEGYSHVCLDDDFCSRAERETDDD